MMPRHATQADVDVMAAIHATAFTAHDAWSRDVFSLQLEMPNVFSLLHPDGGLILVRIAADEAEILTFAVLPECRRRGIGGTMLAQAMQEISSRGGCAVFLEVSVENITAQSLYTRAGFVLAGRRPHYYSDNADALVLRLDLKPPV